MYYLSTVEVLLSSNSGLMDYDLPPLIWEKFSRTNVGGKITAVLILWALVRLFLNQLLNLIKKDTYTKA